MSVMFYFFLPKQFLKVHWDLKAVHRLGSKEHFSFLTLKGFYYEV